MWLYTTKKFSSFLLSLWIVVTVTFFLLHLVPGDPILGEHPIPAELLPSLYATYGLDKPLLSQYITFLQSLLSGNLGLSLVYQGRSVVTILQEGFPLSFQLGIQALCLAIPLGIFLGALGAIRQGSALDKLAMGISTLGIAMPSFVLATLLQLGLAIYCPIFPVARCTSFLHTILPTLSLSLLPMASIARLVRFHLADILSQDFIRTALAKGCSFPYVAIVHGLKNGLLPVLTYLGPLTAQIVTGSFIVERIFAIPGIGQWMVIAVQNRDYPLVLGLTIFFSAILMGSSFLVDLLHKVADPRLRRSYETK